MSNELKALACLLVYPEERLKTDLGDIQECLANSSLVDEEDRKALIEFTTKMAATPLIQLQKDYVATFDLGKRTSLNLFEHLHKDSRDRGAAMNNLVKLYDDHGLVMHGPELPDFLPIVLEFLSGLSEKDALVWLESAGHLLQKLDFELETIGSPWTAVTRTLVHLAGTQKKVAKPELEPPSPETDYFDTPVTFANGNDPVEQSIRFIRNRDE